MSFDSQQSAVARTGRPLSVAVALMNRLTLPRKFALISLLFALPLASVIAIVFFEIRGRMQFARKELQGTAYLRPLWQLLEDVGESRVLARRLAEEGLVARPEVVRRQSRIETAFAALADVDRRLGGTLDTAERSTTLHENWRGLREHLLRLTSEEANAAHATNPPSAIGLPDAATSDRLHHELIVDLRALMQHVGDTSNLILDPDLDSYYLMDAVLLKLPERQVLLAQHRQFTLGKSAVGPLAPAEHEELVRFAGRLEANLADAARGFATAFRESSARDLHARLGPHVDASAEAGEWLAGLLQRQVAQAADATSLAENAAAAESCLVADARLWSAVAGELDGLLSARIAAFRRKMTWILATTAAALGLVAYLWAGFYGSVMRTVAALEHAAERMVDGEFGEAATVAPTSDELGKLVVAFNSIARRLRTEWEQARDESARARAAEAALRETIEAAPNAMLMVDSQGRIVLANSQLARLFGVARAELLGQPVECLVPPEIRERHVAYVREFLKHPQTRLMGQGRELFALHRDGHSFPVEIGLAQLRTEHGPAAVASIVDLTLQREATARIEAARRTAEDANRAKSEFLANMSHEIRTPMNGILGMTELLLNTRLSGDQREYLGMVKNSADALLRILNDILDFSKIEAGRLELETVPFSLRDCVGRTGRTLTVRAAEKGLELACRVAPGIPDRLLGDPGRLRQILVNLIGNALKFTERGEVAVDVSEEDSAATEPDASCVRLHFAVRDTGIGIPADKQARIFGAFEQADSSTTRRYGGTGLGLSISSRLVGLMGGRIWLESVVGQGTTFHFTASFGVSRDPAREPVELESLRNLPVLVVDDNATNRLILREMLQSWRMSPRAVASGSEALAELARAATDGAPIALVLLDCMMPEMDGFMLAERIREDPRLGQPALIMVSSAVRPEDGERCEHLGISRLMTKPFIPSEMLDGIVETLHARRGSTATSLDDSLPIGPRLAATQAGRSLRLLLAEDNVINQRVATGLLRERGHTVVIADDGRAAVGLVESQPFDAVLMDMQMPELDGLEATQAIRAVERQTGGHVPIIAMTAAAMKGDRERCLTAGMDGYVSKPIDAAELFRVLEQVVGPGSGAEPRAEAESKLVPAADVPVIDVSVAQKRLPGGAARVPEFAQLLAEESQSLLEDMRSALVAQDVERFRRGAHTLRGATALFDARRVIGLATELEELGAASRLEDAASKMPRLDVEVARLIAALREIGGK